MIKQISFDQICELWEMLHPKRKHVKYSTMGYLGGEDNIANRDVFYFGYFIDDKLVGVNSCHDSAFETIRSRGLFVLPEYRNNKIGLKLLKHTLEFSKNHVDFVWSFPKVDALRVYERAGFKRTSTFTPGDYGVNCYASCEIEQNS